MCPKETNYVGPTNGTEARERRPQIPSGRVESKNKSARHRKFQMAALKRQKSGLSENVVFKFYNITLDKVPFCHKTLSVRMMCRLNRYSTEQKAAEDFRVNWSKAIEIKRLMTHDTAGKIVPTIIDVLVLAHQVRGSGVDEVAYGKFDLAQILRQAKKHLCVPLQSNILDSNLRFEIETLGGDSFVEVAVQDEFEDEEPLPVIPVYQTEGWFSFHHNVEAIEADSTMLVKVATEEDDVDVGIRRPLSRS